MSTLVNQTGTVTPVQQTQGYQPNQTGSLQGKEVSVSLRKILASFAKCIYKFSVELFFPKNPGLIAKNNPAIQAHIATIKNGISQKLQGVLERWAKELKTNLHDQTYQLEFSSMGNPHDIQITVKKGKDAHIAIMKVLKKCLKEINNQDVNLGTDKACIKIDFSVKTVTYNSPVYDSEKQRYTYTKTPREISFKGIIAPKQEKPLSSTKTSPTPVQTPAE